MNATTEQPETAIQKVRRRYGLSYKALGEIAGIKKQSAHAICTGKTRPSLEVAYKWIDYFGEDLSLEDLFPRSASQMRAA